MNYYISRNYKGLNSAGNKAKSDIEGIVERTCGFRNAGLPLSTYTNTVVHFVMNLAGVLKAPFCLRRGDVLLLQYPLKKYYAFVCNMAHLRGAKVVTLIHDLGSFRRKARGCSISRARYTRNYSSCFCSFFISEKIFSSGFYPEHRPHKNRYYYLIKISFLQ